MFCTNCGNQIPDDTRFCPFCGVRIAPVPEDSEVPAEPAPSEPASAEPSPAEPTPEEPAPAEPSETPETASRRSLDRTVNEVERIVIRIQRGDSSAFEDLFERTKRYTAWCIRHQGVPESDVDDVLQDVYVSVYQNIGRLRDPRAALAWIKSTAFRRSVNFLTRTHDEVMAEEDTQDWLARNEASAEAEIAQPFALPEDAVQSAETRQVLRAFIEDLPEDQRRVFVARYLGEVSAADIASTYGMNANTVRSKLMRARQTLQAKVEAYAERTGTQLYSVAGLPALWMLFGDQFGSIRVGVTVMEILGLAGGTAAAGATATKVLADAAVGQALEAPLTATHVGNVAVEQLTATHVGNVAAEQLTATHVANVTVGSAAGGSSAAGAGTAAGGAAAGGAAAGAGAASAATAAAGIGLGAKIAAGIATIALAGGVGYVAATGGFSGTPSGGGQQGTATTQEAGAGAAEEEPTQEEIYANALETYSEVLDDVDSIEFGNGIDKSEGCTYYYSVVEATGDDVPELLVMCQPSYNAYSYVRVFSTEENGTELVDPLLTLSVGGGNMYFDVVASLEGTCLYQVSMYRGTGIAEGDPDTETVPYTIDDGELVGGEPVSYVSDAGAAIEQDYSFIDWWPVDERSLLEGMLGVDPGDSSEGDLDQAIADARAAGLDVYSGTMRVLKPEDLLALQGYDSFPNGPETGYYVVLVLDEGTEVTARNGDGQGSSTRPAQLIEIAHHTRDNYGYEYEQGDPATYLERDGVPTTIAVDPDETWFPSDTSLPLGEPRCHSAQILDW